MRIVIAQPALAASSVSLMERRSLGLSGAAVDVCGLIKRYPNGVRALNGMTFSVDAGSIFALLGPNGAGKSSTVRILCTLLRADGGRASIHGYDVALSPEHVRATIGLVPQAASSDLDGTGRENLMLQGRLHGLSGRLLRVRVDNLLEQFGLAAAADQIVRTYSGGMERKLDIALALVHRPKVLFLDEPTRGLDPEARTGLWQALKGLCSSNGLTILLTTHYLEEADRIADRIAIVNHGEVVASGTARELKSAISDHVIEIEVNESGREDYIRLLLSRIASVCEIQIQGSSILANSDEATGALASILCALDSARITVSSIKSISPSLDDVYYSFAGYPPQNGLEGRR